MAQRHAPVPPRRVILANPRGFCAGVVRAIDAVERAIMQHGAPVHVRRPIVHNRGVIDQLERIGARFVQENSDIPEGAVTVLSAHGVAPTVHAEATARRLRIIDATCPLVTKVHDDVIAHHRAGRHILLIGHPDHPEIIGTRGQVPDHAFSLISTPSDVVALPLPAAKPVAYAVQTTFSVQESRAIIAAIEARFTNVAGPRSGNICYATTNRQAAIAAIARQADCVLVVGDPMSSNANRLVEVAQAAGCNQAALVRDRCDLDWAMIDCAATIGLTAAASTPDSAVHAICDALEARGFAMVEWAGIVEKAAFPPVAIDQP